MGVFDLFRRKPKPGVTVLSNGAAVAAWTGERARVGGSAARGWLGAQPSRLMSDLPGSIGTAPNRDIRQQLGTLRNRARWLAQNEGYTAGFLKMLRRNVVGPSGFTLQMAVRADRGTGFDEDANNRIEAAWKAWSRVGACDVTGRLSFTDLCGLAVLGIARDGEAMIRMHRGWARGEHGFALEVLDPSQIEDDVNGRPPGTPEGHVVRAGVEMDAYARPTAYWMRTTVPNDDPAALVRPQRQRVRVPADEILHLFLPEWPQQVRGIPWIANGIRALAMLDGYSEAELTAARVSAGKMGFYKIDGDAEVPADLEEDGRLVQKAEAGTFELLPKGVEFQGFDPQHPSAAFKDFVSAMLRPIAAGAGVSYNAFANDAEGMNYSALRATELEDRDEFRTLQHWFIGCMCRPVFSAWLRETLVRGTTALPPGKFWKFDAAEFVPRGWQWVDPLKEVNAMAKALELGITSRTQIIAAQGGDIDAIAAELRAEKAQFEGLLATAPAAPKPPNPDDDEED